MSALTDARDHARKMAEWTDPREGGFLSGYCRPDARFDPDHPGCNQDTCPCSCHPREVMSDSDRALWKLMADEWDAHLEPDEVAAEDGPGLFEEGS